ncbi:hemolysin III family protein [Actibacterium sp. EMB200-NS6]
MSVHSAAAVFIGPGISPASTALRSRLSGTVPERRARVAKAALTPMCARRRICGMAFCGARRSLCRMRAVTTTRSGYSRAEFLSDAAVHVVGLSAVLVAVPVLVTLAVLWRGDPAAMLGTAIYGVTLIAMILCSALYHMVRRDAWSGLLRRLDHAAIYFKIAGTYTPFTLLSGGQGAVLLTGLWGAALAGSALRIFRPGRFRWIAFALYLVMGWAGVFAGWPVLGTLSRPVVALIVTGGILYTIGTAFFLCRVLPFHNTIWHVFVLVATAIFYAAVVVHLADTSVHVAMAGS